MFCMIIALQILGVQSRFSEKATKLWKNLQKCKNSTSERVWPLVCTVGLGRPRHGIGNRHTFLISFQLQQRKSNGRYRLSHIFLRGCKIGL